MSPIFSRRSDGAAERRAGDPVRPRTLLPVFALFFLSGAASLLAQVVWVRMFSHVFGAQVVAISTVLAAFLGGLSWGGAWAGRRAPRIRRPLATYAALEALAAAAAALVPVLLASAAPLVAAVHPALEGSFAALTAFRFLVSCAILVPPTFLMGATLPVLVLHAERSGSGASSVAALYAVNTFGAAFGALAASFVLLPALGVRGTLAAGVGVYLLVSLIAIALSRAPGEGEGAAFGRAPIESAKEFPPKRAAPPRAIVLAAATLGFSALVCEVLWTRTLTLALGTTTYAFAVVLATFLFGIASGSLAARAVLRSAADARGDSESSAAADRANARAAALFPFAPAEVGFLSLLLLPLFDRLPDLYVALAARGAGTWGEALAAKFLLASLPLLPPTFVSGAAFPLAVAAASARAPLQSPAAAASATGTLYAANTLGAIAGSIAASLFLALGLGLRGGLVAASAVLVAASCALFARRRPLVAAGLAAAAVLVAVVLPEWNRAALTRGGFAVGVDLRRSGRETLGRDLSEVVFHEEGLTSTISVRRSGRELTMQMNGVTEASNTGDLGTQILLGFIPAALHPAPKDALVIGLGSGITAAAVGRFPTVASIDCVEISESVVRAAALFDDANDGILGDARTRLVVGDGRNHLALSRRTYDIIVSEPSNVWNSGIGDLMTVEFFASARRALRPNGVVCSWIQGYSLSPEALRSVVAAALVSFPRVTVWTGSWGDFMIVAGDESRAIDAAHLRALGAEPRLFDLLRRADAPDLTSFLSLNVLAGDASRRFAGAQPPNTDDNLFLELEAPKLLHVDTLARLFEAVHAAAGGTEELLVEAPPELAALLPQLRAARALESRARLALREGRGAGGLPLFEEALRLHPGTGSIASGLAQAWTSRGRALARQNDLAGSVESYLRAAQADPETAEPFAHLARLYAGAGDLERAERAIADAALRDAGDPTAWTVRAEIHLARRESEPALEAARRALEIEPHREDAILANARALEQLGRRDEADSALTAALRRAPDSPGLDTAIRKLRGLPAREIPSASGAEDASS